MNETGRRKARRGAIPALLVVFVLSAVIIAGCGSDAKSTTGQTEPVWVQTVIYFGRDIPGGKVVTDEEFVTFLEEVVTKEFPEGLTAYDAYGQMQKGDGGIEKQSTKVVLLVHEKTKANSEAVKRIIDSYRSRFGTPQVMRTTIPIDVEFFQSAG